MNRPEMERVILGSILIEPAIYAENRFRLSPQAFDVFEHQLIFSAIQTVHDLSEPIDAVSVAERIGGFGDRKFIDARYLIDMMESVINIGRSRNLINVLLEGH